MNSERSPAIQITPQKLQHTIDDLFETYRDHTYPKWSKALNGRVDMLSFTVPETRNTISVTRDKCFWAITDSRPGVATSYGNAIDGGMGVGYMVETGNAEVWEAEAADFENAMFTLIALGNYLDSQK